MLVGKKIKDRKDGTYQLRYVPFWSAQQSKQVLMNKKYGIIIYRTPSANKLFFCRIVYCDIGRSACPTNNLILTKGLQSVSLYITRSTSTIICYITLKIYYNQSP